MALKNLLQLNICRWLSARARHYFSVGVTGERVAVRYLNSISYKIISRNWRCRLGEIDIVALDRNVLVFVEVKTRKKSRTEDYSPYNAVKYRKIRRIELLSEAFIEQQGARFRRTAANCRFDIVGITYETGEWLGKWKFELEHWRDVR